MNYLDIYWSRMNHMGESTSERIRNGGIRSFYKWLDESPHTIRNLSVERGLYFDGIILTNKDKEHKKIMFLNVANDIPLVIGDIMNWKLDNGEIEKWILFQEEKKVNGTYRTFFILRCNYLMKWVDAQGHIQQSWSHFTSSLDSEVKGNFRTWNSLITPQPNKYAELIMPRYPIDRSTNFIAEEESWTVVEYDHTSVPGIIYLSLTEGKINSIYDDVKNNLADTDKIADYKLLVPDKEQIFNIGDVITPIFTLTKNGEPYQADIEYITTDKKIARLIDGKLTAVGPGVVDIIIQLKEHPEIKENLSVTIGEVIQEFAAYIEGKDSIRLDRTSSYKLVGTSEIIGEVVFSIDSELAKIIDFAGDTCTVKTNNKNQLGDFILTASYNGNIYTKTISIIPLW